MNAEAGDLVTPLYELYLALEPGPSGVLERYTAWIPGEFATVLESENIQGVDVLTLLIGGEVCRNVMDEEVRVLSKRDQSIIL
jgi:hypothetical protein